MSEDPAKHFFVKSGRRDRFGAQICKWCDYPQSVHVKREHMWEPPWQITVATIAFILMTGSLVGRFIWTYGFMPIIVVVSAGFGVVEWYKSRHRKDQDAGA